MRGIMKKVVKIEKFIKRVEWKFTQDFKNGLYTALFFVGFFIFFSTLTGIETMIHSEEIVYFSILIVAFIVFIISLFYIKRDVYYERRI
jgi:hypothetical protein